MFTNCWIDQNPLALKTCYAEAPFDKLHVLTYQYKSIDTGLTLAVARSVHSPRTCVELKISD